MRVVKVRVEIESLAAFLHGLSVATGEIEIEAVGGADKRRQGIEFLRTLGFGERLLKSSLHGKKDRILLVPRRKIRI